MMAYIVYKFLTAVVTDTTLYIKCHAVCFLIFSEYLLILLPIALFSYAYDTTYLEYAFISAVRFVLYNNTYEDYCLIINYEV